MKRDTNKIDEAENLAIYLNGVADGAESDSLKCKAGRAAELLDKLADNMCGQGYVGCRGGRECSSDHK